MNSSFAARSLTLAAITLLGLLAAEPKLSAQCVLPPAGLVAWWPGNGNAKDVWNTNNGTLTNGTTFASGKVGQAFSFDGVDDWVSLPRINLSAFNSASFVAWVKPANITANGYYEIIRQEPPLSVPDWLLSFQESGTVLSFGLSAGGTYEELDVPVNAGDYTDGNWHLIVATYDGTTKRLYRDGVEIGSQAKTGNIRFAGATHAIGAQPPHIGFPVLESFDGLIDEVAIFKRALTPSEIASIYSADSAGMCAVGLVTGPTDQLITCGSNVTFTAVTTNAVQIQWQFNGTNIAGATNSTLTISNATSDLAGVYTILVPASADRILQASARLGFSFMDLHLYAVVTIKGRVGDTYRVEYANSLTPPVQWSTLTNIASLPLTPYDVIDYGSTTTTKRFYRVVSNACP
ncbi:MAG: hypothetical protein EPO07_12585 [Verrucomicrobia bacterium]|nr:MAG: hypothetical protein EPO07_12585 [Verrucomicrobiota bacterium]